MQATLPTPAPPISREPGWATSGVRWTQLEPGFPRSCPCLSSLMNLVPENKSFSPGHIDVLSSSLKEMRF